MSRNLPYNRSSRVADEIYELLSNAIITDLSDPRIKGATLTRVGMTKDLKVARVYFHMGDVDDKAKERALAGFESSSGFLKKRIASELKLRYTPNLEFYFDDSVDLCEVIEGLFKNGGAE